MPPFEGNSPIDTVPNEVLGQIFANLCINDRARVSRRLYIVVHTNLPNLEPEIGKFTEEPWEKPRILLENSDHLSSLLSIAKLKDSVIIEYDTDNFAKKIIDALTKCPQSIKNIELRSEGISDDVVSYINEIFVSTPNLSVSIKVFDKVPEISKHSGIKTLELSCNRLDPNTIYPSSLTKLIIKRPHGDIRNFFQNMASLKHLQELMLYNSEFEDQETYNQFEGTISSLPKLESLMLRRCSFLSLEDIPCPTTNYLKYLGMKRCDDSNILLERLVSSSESLQCVEWTIESLSPNLRTLSRIVPMLKNKDVEFRLEIVSDGEVFNPDEKIPRKLGDCMKQFAFYGETLGRSIDNFIEVDAFRNCERIKFIADLDDKVFLEITERCTNLRSIEVHSRNITEKGIARLIDEFRHFHPNELDIIWLTDVWNTCTDVSNLYDKLCATENFLKSHKINIVYKLSTSTDSVKRSRIEIQYENGKRAIVRNYNIDEFSLAHEPVVTIS